MKISMTNNLSIATILFLIVFNPFYATGQNVYELPNDSLKVQQLYDIAYEIEIQHPDSAIKMYQLGKSISQNIGYKMGIGRGLQYQGIVHSDQGNYQEAIRLYQDAINAFEQIPYEVGIGNTEKTSYKGNGVVRISYSHNINILNSSIIGTGTFGLNTYAVYNLKFKKSEITNCSLFIFDIERTRKLEFIDSDFHNNNLFTSVLGGFTNASREISFLNCKFENNLPKMSGNPLFNQRDLYEPVLFTNCTFSNNVGYKWYGDQIKLVDCIMDVNDFIGLAGAINESMNQ